MKRCLLFILILSLLVSITLLPATQPAEKILVATEPTSHRFTYIDEQQSIVGFDIDLMKAIASKENLEIESLR